jgi:hypothetical protein
MKPRTNESLDESTARGILGLVSSKISEQWFGAAFPYPCPDGQFNAGNDERKMQARMAVYGILWPEDSLRQYDRDEDLDLVPTDGHLFDLIEFSYEHIARPIIRGEHGWFNHYHYSYDQAEGRNHFEAEVNRIFERNGIAYELKSGEVTRIAPTGLQEALAETTFRTGDPTLDGLLEDARHKFLNRDLKVRKESLERLWDAWERLKTIKPGKDKSAQAHNLLATAVTDPALFARIDKEARELTEIGNSFMIRHTETTKVPIEGSAHVDYLFHRMFALILLLLRGNGLGG